MASDRFMDFPGNPEHSVIVDLYMTSTKEHVHRRSVKHDKRYQIHLIVTPRVPDSVHGCLYTYSDTVAS